MTTANDEEEHLDTFTEGLLVVRKTIKRLKAENEKLKENEGVLIGGYTIKNMDKGIHIMHESGEGGGFNETDFYECIDTFFKENF